MVRGEAPGRPRTPGSHAMARRRRIPRATRERQVLETAGRVFATRGFDAASMEEIAGAAGTSRPMLYHYFGSKEGLYVAYVNLACRDMIAAVEAAVAAAGPRPEQMLRAGALAYCRSVGEHRDSFYLLFREMGGQGREVAGHRLRLRREVAAALRRLLRPPGPGQAPPAYEPLAEAFLGAARSLADWWLDHPEVSAEAVTDHLMDFTFAGLRRLLAGREAPGE